MWFTYFTVFKQKCTNRYILCFQWSCRLRAWIYLGFCSKVMNYQTDNYLSVLNSTSNEELEWTRWSLIKWLRSFGIKHSIIWSDTCLCVYCHVFCAVDFCGARAQILRHAETWSFESFPVDTPHHGKHFQTSKYIGKKKKKKKR